MIAHGICRRLVLAVLFASTVAACGSGGSGNADEMRDVAPDPGASDARADALAGDGETAGTAEASPLEVPAPEAGPPAGTVTVDPAAPGAAVPDDFVGLSVEIDEVPAYLGDGQGGAAPAVIELLRSYEAEGHRMVVRIGGNSQDLAWWNPDGAAARPAGVDTDLGKPLFDTLAAVHAAAGTRFILGLDLAMNDPGNAATFIQAARSELPDGAFIAFEAGNEPDFYPKNGRRPLDWGYTDYVPDLEAFVDALHAKVTPPPPIAGPAFLSGLWMLGLDDLIGAEAGRLALVTAHVYPYTLCAGGIGATPSQLLDPSATTDVGTTFAAHAQVAHGAGLPFRMGEMNSVSCGGQDGVSDTLASALWAFDLGMRLAAGGVDGINFHTPGNFYAVFVRDSSGGVTVRPLWYALRLISIATASHGRIVAAQADVTSRVEAWATLGSDGAVRVALANLDATGDASVRLIVKGRAGAATLTRLEGPSLDAKTGIVLGGQTWDGTTDGHPAGSAQVEVLVRDGDAWVVPLPSLHAAVVTVP